MIFLGTAFLSGKHTLYPPADKTGAIESVSLADGTHDHLFISKNPDKTVLNWTEDWDYDSVMNADFNKNLDAGNSGFSLKNTDTIVVRRRELLKENWITIYTKEIHTLEDFDIHFIDRFARGGDTKYVYRISSTLNGMENSYVEQELLSYFEGMYLADRDGIYGTPYDLDGCNTTQHIKSEILETYDRYPTVVSNGDVNYEYGSVTGTFLKISDDTSTLDRPGSMQHRQTFKDRLASHKPFILKMPDGRIWMARCVGTPSDSSNGSADLRQLTFDWVEIGNADDMEALYYNGLSDVPVRWWY